MLSKVMSYWTAVFLSLFLAPSLLCGEEMIKASNYDASPINQRRAYGNGCGPASLLNAFQFGSEKWQEVFRSVPGRNSKTRIRYVVSQWGDQPSNHIQGVKRWNAQHGINLVDLHDIANEMCQPLGLPEIEYEILTRKSREQPSELLKRCHRLITNTLSNGLPPILGIQRYAYRDSKELNAMSWWPIRAHFIVIIGVSKRIESDSDTFRIEYVEPYGGFTREGTIHTDTQGFTNSPFLGATLPSALIGKSLLKKGETSILSCSLIMGDW